MTATVGPLAFHLQVAKLCSETQGIDMDASNASNLKYWLMKAEPDSRVVKGKDVKFSVDDFESVGTTPWEGVRNFEARNLMKEMSVGDKILFYHSNCKNPGIAGFAEVCKEVYPDYTAWDSAHPYFDEKTDKENPKWFMIDAKFVSRVRHFVPLSLLRHIADLPSSTLPEAISYIGKDGIHAIKAMPLITRGRLSVQRVPSECWDVIEMMADKGGWDSMSFEKKKATKSNPPPKEGKSSDRKTRSKKLSEAHALTMDEGAEEADEEGFSAATTREGRKRKLSEPAKQEDEGESMAPRRKSARTKK